MSKPQAPITKADLDKFVEEDSDFGFEMSVLTELRSVGVSCMHSGTYTDPFSEKIRQFDIRGFLIEADCMLKLAVECKSLRTPILVSAVPRMPHEAFHCVVAWEGHATSYHSPVSCECVMDSTVYEVDMPVAKKTDQIRRESGGGLISDDSATFDKMGQAINSAKDLVQDIVEATIPRFRAVVPVLVVPTQMLWQVEYDANGKRITEAQMVNQASLYVNHVCTGTNGIHRESYWLSHLEIVTFDSLSQVVKRWMGKSGLFCK